MSKKKAPHVPTVHVISKAISATLRIHYLGELHHDAASFSEFLSQCYRCTDTRLVRTGYLVTPFFSASRRTFPHFEKNTKLQPGPSCRCHQLWSPGCGLGGCHPKLELCLGFKSPDCLLLHKFCPPPGVRCGGWRLSAD